MLIIGLYPHQFQNDHQNSPLVESFLKLKTAIPPQVIIHLLPMWVSEGDGGFAVSSWSRIEPHFGTLEDLMEFTNSWRVVIDGIFNHVAWGHPIAQQFLRNPDENADLIHAIKSDEPTDAPYAPRGGSVYLEREIAGSSWYIWHTFGSQAVDINLSNEDVREQVETAISFYQRMGIWGLRLDALGYFGKSTESVDHNRNPGGVEVHNEDGVSIAKSLISYASNIGLHCLLQIDNDKKIGLYEVTSEQRPSVIDYSFTAQFVFSVLFQDPNRIAEHLSKIRENDCFSIVRPLRTHDGILFRSRNLSDDDRAAFEKYLDAHNLQKRVTNDLIYENNNSLPHLLGFRQDRAGYFRKIAAGIIIAELTASFSYIYLNALVGDEPEGDLEFPSDPREMQRRPIDPALLEDCIGNKAYCIAELLSTMASLFNDAAERSSYQVWVEGKLLRIENEGEKMSAAINFSDGSVQAEASGKVIFSDGYNSTTLDAFGIVLWQYEPERKTT